MSRRAVRALLAIACSALAASAVAIAAGPVDLHNGGDHHAGIGQLGGPTLSPAVTYQASLFPVALRLRPPDGLWGGAQYESGRFRFVQFLHRHRTGDPPLRGVGYITLEAAKGSTPSAATAIKRLHATPHMAAGPIKPTRVAGFTGQQFDATMVGSDLNVHADCPGNKKCPPETSLAPFLRNYHCGACGDPKFDPRETHDVKVATKGQLFRIIAINVRGKTVVIYLESVSGGPKFPATTIFPTFLPYANRALAALRFPAT